MAKTNLGEMACETCGRLVIVKKNENETLSYRCDYCDSAPYQRKDTLAALTWLKKIKPFDHVDRNSPPAAEPKPAPAPVVKPRIPLFG
jgi:DNA-directed RNA polymerase subunit M/transcription elongation factor TFIIS